MALARSTFYYQVKSKTEEDKKIVDLIEDIIVNFTSYGYRRITKQLHREGLKINHKRVLRLMRANNLTCKIKKHFVATTDSNHSFKIYPNLIKDLVINKLNQVWQADITYIRLLKSFVYLAVILDSFSRKVVGYAISKRIDKNLTIAALKMAVQLRKPAPGCIHHSDRGVQYASLEYVNYLKEQEFQISMSRKGNPYDNAKAESFMKTLKYDEVYLSDYETYDQIVANVSKFIEDVYNKKRLHSAIGYLPPDEFEQKFIQLQNQQDINSKGGLDHISNILKNMDL